MFFDFVRENFGWFAAGGVVLFFVVIFILDALFGILNDPQPTRAKDNSK